MKARLPKIQHNNTILIYRKYSTSYGLIHLKYVNDKITLYCAYINLPDFFMLKVVLGCIQMRNCLTLYGVWYCLYLKF